MGCPMDFRRQQWVMLQGNRSPWRPSATVLLTLEALSMLINLLSILIYTAQYWPALRLELKPSAIASPTDTR